MKNYLIKDIEALTEYEVLKMNHEVATINEHQVYFVDFGGYFGYSALVFRAGAHLYYANDYELHHKGKTHEELKAWYEDTLKYKLFSDEMIPAAVADYQEAERKEYYLRNYYPQMCDDKISAFRICTNEAESAAFDKEVEGMIYNPIGFFYTNDKAFSDRLIELYKIAIKSKEPSKDNYNYWFDAFKYEMFNHEYAINWDADIDTLSAFGNVKYRSDITLSELFDQLNFSDIQRKAYRAAASYVMANSDY